MLRVYSHAVARHWLGASPVCPEHVGDVPGTVGLASPGDCLLFAAVQEERQRGKDRNENEVESTSSANEDMPVEKILEAELAVEPKTETYVEANMGLNPSSVSVRCSPASVSPVLTRLPSCSSSQRFEPFCCCGLCPNWWDLCPAG